MACCSGATRGKWSMAKCLISLARRARFGHTTFAFGEKNGHLRRRSPEYAAVRYHILESLHNFDFILCFNTLRYAAIFTRTASVVLPRKQQFGAMVRMARLTKCVVDAAEKQSSDYIIWDDELPGFGLRVFRSGQRSYLVQYRADGRTRRYTIGIHGVWTPALARKQARVLLGRIAQGENPSEVRRLNARAITVKELCTRYLEDAENGLVLGKGERPKKASTIYVD